MKQTKKPSRWARTNGAPAMRPPRRYALALYVAGMTRTSTRAIETIKALCEEYMPGRYDLEVIDLYQRRELARGEQIIAAPTLIKKLPRPLRRLIGDMTRRDRFLIALDLRKGK